MKKCAVYKKTIRLHQNGVDYNSCDDREHHSGRSSWRLVAATLTLLNAAVLM